MTFTQILTLTIAPVLLAGIASTILRKLTPTLLNIPVDFGKKINNKRVFGDNKTVRGFVYMTLFTAVFGQLISYKILGTNLIAEYAFIGFLYRLGELPNSYMKRRTGIKPGGESPHAIKKQFLRFFDAIDSVIVVGLGYYFIYEMTFSYFIVIMMISVCLHYLTHNTFKLLKLK